MRVGVTHLLAGVFIRASANHGQIPVLFDPPQIQIQLLKK